MIDYSFKVISAILLEHGVLIFIIWHDKLWLSELAIVLFDIFAQFLLLLWGQIPLSALLWRRIPAASCWTEWIVIFDSSPLRSLLLLTLKAITVQELVDFLLLFILDEHLSKKSSRYCLKWGIFAPHRYQLRRHQFHLIESLKSSCFSLT